MHCSLCGEVLPEGEEGFHRTPHIELTIPTWEGCLRAATGDFARIIRVHQKITVDANPAVTLR